MKTGYNLFDAHFHIGAYGQQSFAGHVIQPISPEVDHETGSDCMRYMNRYGIRGGVVVPTYLERQMAAFEYNERVLEAVEAYEELWGGFWVSPLEEVEEALRKTLSRLPHPKIRALKIASNTWAPYSLDPSTWPARLRRNVEEILAHAAAHRLIVHFHTGYLPGADPLDVEAFLNVYGSKARYQWVHMGEAIAPAFRFIPRFAAWIEAGYDIYTDTSIVPGFAPAWMLEILDRRNLGFDRVFFATDAPWGRFPSEFEKIAGLEIENSVKQALLATNARRAYGLDA